MKVADDDVVITEILEGNVFDKKLKIVNDPGVAI